MPDYGRPAFQGPRWKQSSAAHARDARKRTERAEWAKVRRVVLARDGRRCRACGRRDGVEVHHVRFRSVGGRHTSANCCCLCTLCHADIHAYRLTLSGNADRKLKIERALS